MAADGIGMDVTLLDNNPIDGLYNPAFNGAPKQTAPPAATSDPNWYRYPNISLMNVGTSQPEVMLMLTDVAHDVCAAINNLLTGSSTIPVLSAPDATANNLYDYSYALDLTNDPATNGRTEGCLSSNDGMFFYYRAVMVR